ncbi:5314_t:CDS:1, partial [Acaulospora colombiana]
NDPHLDQVSIKQLVEAKEKWLTAFNRSYGYTLRSLAFPPFDNPRDRGDRSIISLLTSALPLPRAPLQSCSSTHQEAVRTLVDDLAEYSREWWSNRFEDVLREVESRQEPPVMLIGDTA